MKNLAVLAGLAVVLGGVAWYISTAEEKNIEQAAAPVKEVFGGAVTSGTLTHISVSAPGGKAVTLEAIDGVWYTNPARKHKADANAMTRVLSQLEKCVTGEVVSTDAKDFDDYDLSETSATKVSLQLTSREPEEWLIGKVGSSYMNSYVRKQGSSEVLSADANLSNLFNNSQGWRDRSILTINKDAVVGIEQEGTSATYVMKREGSTWSVKERAGSPAQNKTTEMLSALSSLKANDFEDDTSTETLAKYSLDVPEQKMTIVTEDTTTSPSTEKKTVLLFGKTDTLRNLRYVKLADSPDIYVIGGHAAKQLVPLLDELVPLPKPEAEEDVTSSTQ